MSRIGIIGPFALPDSFEDNISDSLRRLGHDVVPLGPTASPFSGRLSSIATEFIRKVSPVEQALQMRIAKRASNLQLDLVLSVQGDLLPDVVTAIRKSGSKIALWFPDHIMNLGRMLMFVGAYDALFFKEPWIVDRARDVLGQNVYYLPEACNPAWHRPSDVQMERVIVLAGNLYPWRAKLVERLLSMRFPVRIHGSYVPRWLKSSAVQAHSGIYVAREAKARVFRSAGVVLNNLHPCEISGVNCRLFEAAGSGAAVLCEHRAELPKKFILGEEVESYTTFDELTNKLSDLLDSPDRARKLGDRAAIRAHADHSYEERLGRIFDVLELADR